MLVDPKTIEFYFLRGRSLYLNPFESRERISLSFMGTIYKKFENWSQRFWKLSLASKGEDKVYI